MVRWSVPVVVGAALFLLGGCSKGPGLIDIDGTVTLNNEPVVEGDITFIPVDPTVGAEGGRIVDGKFKMKARAGKNRVEIRATRAVPGKTTPSAAGPGAPPEPVIESIIPSRYNEESKLEEEVASGKTKFEFNLKSP